MIDYLKTKDYKMMKDLENNSVFFKNFFWMSQESFNTILNLIKQKITHARRQAFQVI